MNPVPKLDSAAERLLDVALTQVMATLPRAAPRPPRRWLAAAIVVLGVTVSAASMWLARRPSTPHAAQQPAIPPAVSASGRAEIEALPIDTQHLAAELFTPQEVVSLRRFRGLRELWIQTGATPGVLGAAAVWKNAPADSLAPLAELAHLEALHLPRELTSALLLQPLQRCEALRELDVHQGIARDAQLFEVLAALPHLGTLRLNGVTLAAEDLERLQPRALGELLLNGCAGLDTAGFARVCAMPSLRRLGIRALRGSDPSVAAQWQPAGELPALRGLPHLQRLELDDFELRDSDLEALPDTLTELELTSYRGLSPSGLAQLRRLGGLQRLSIYSRASQVRDPDAATRAANVAHADAVAGVVGSLRLTHAVCGPLASEALFDALGGQPDLIELEVMPADARLVRRLGASRSLRQLQMSFVADLSLDDLRPLAAVRSLRKLQLFECGEVSEVDVRALFGAEVEVRVTGLRSLRHRVR